MGKTVVKQSDVDLMYKKLCDYSGDGSMLPEYQEFAEIVDEIFGVDISDKTLEEMCNSVTDENKQELVDFGKPVGKEVI